MKGSERGYVHACVNVYVVAFFICSVCERDSQGDYDYAYAYPGPIVEIDFY